MKIWDYVEVVHQSFVAADDDDDDVGVVVVAAEIVAIVPIYLVHPVTKVFDCAAVTSYFGIHPHLC